MLIKDLLEAQIIDIQKYFSIALQIFLLALFATVAIARPQVGDLDLDSLDKEQRLLDRLGPVNDNPQYQYSYQIADDPSQNYIAHNEARDGDEVTGKYR